MMHHGRDMFLVLLVALTPFLLGGDAAPPRQEVSGSQRPEEEPTPAAKAESDQRAPSATDKRPMSVDDLFKLESIGDLAVSPDGQEIAVTLKRPLNTCKNYKRDFLDDNDHADVYLVPRAGGTSKNLTEGLQDGIGYWKPAWSPDGQRIAMLSTKGGDNVRLYVWERKTGEVKRMTERGVDLYASTGGSARNPYIWLSDTRLVCGVMPAGKQHLGFVVEQHMQQTATREWPKTEKGSEPAVSVLESGIEIPETARPLGQILEIDVESGKSTVLADGNFHHVMLSPNKHYVGVVAETGAVPPSPKHPLRFENLQRSKAGIIALDEKRPVRWVEGLVDPRLGGGEIAHAWSPDGDTLAMIAKSDRDDELAETLFVIEAKEATAQRVGPEKLKVKSVAWTSGNDLLAYGSNESSGKGKRADWCAFNRADPKASLRNLTSKLAAAPASLLRSGQSKSAMIGVADGKLWTVDASSGETAQVTVELPEKIASIIWPKANEPEPTPASSLVVELEPAKDVKAEKAAKRKAWFLLTPAKGSAEAVPFVRPSDKAQLVQYLPNKDLSVFSANEPDGTFLWTSGKIPASFAKCVALNEFLSLVAEAERLLIEYRGVEGDTLKGLVLLPPGYEKGKRYPVVSWVYAGSVRKDTNYSLADKNKTNCLNLNMLTSRGYVVLVPSMPLSPDGEASDPAIDLPKGVLNAVDKLIDLGIADPNKLAVMGQSYGGYSTYSLVTYTKRFKSAIALAGLSDLNSFYGVFDARFRYGEFAHEDLFGPAWSETGQGRMGNPPWKDLSRYIRNSPIFVVDRVQTPLLIIQGDVDYVSQQQGEEFFMGLYREGKRARFVRYWGEGHVLRSPANIRDMWQRIHGWLEECFQEKTSSGKGDGAIVDK